MNGHFTCYGLQIAFFNFLGIQQDMLVDGKFISQIFMKLIFAFYSILMLNIFI